ncbi:MAG: DNA-binding response regulator [Nitrospirae bacterium]|nr:MAG: DNA-binding response regulator [Nitrospirota bacterium]
MPLRVLVIEDEKPISDIVRAYLEKDGFVVTVAETAEEGLAYLKEDFDLIILDLMLPDMEGEEVCKAIREVSDVPIIMLTAKSSEDDRVKGLGLGADDYVVKPFSPRELVARVKALLRRTGALEKGIFSFNRGNLVIKPQTMEVFKNGTPVRLTQTEFKLLMKRAERPGQVFPRQQLVNLILGYDYEGYDRTIDAHIKNIRHKIEDNPRQPQYIQTIYGVGYKFTGQKDEN